MQRHLTILAILVISVCTIGCQMPGKKNNRLRDVIPQKEIQSRAARDPFPRADEPVTPHQDVKVAVAPPRGIAY